MKKMLILTLLVACVGVFASGCAGLGHNADEREVRREHIWKAQQRMLVDDWDYFWLHDRSSALTSWNFKVGD
ncbi:MAG: hypothetical protein ACLFV7_09460 [Phycisphaerae bacterium]